MKQHTYRDFELKLIYNVQCLQANRPCRCAFLYVYLYMYMNYLQRSIFLLLVALLDTYLVTNTISRLGIVIKNERRQVNLYYNIGIAKETRSGCLVHIVQ